MKKAIGIVKSLPLTETLTTGEMCHNSYWALRLGEYHARARAGLRKKTIKIKLRMIRIIIQSILLLRTRYHQSNFNSFTKFHMGNSSSSNTTSDNNFLHLSQIQVAAFELPEHHTAIALAPASNASSSTGSSSTGSSSETSTESSQSSEYSDEFAESRDGVEVRPPHAGSCNGFACGSRCLRSIILR